MNSWYTIVIWVICPTPLIRLYGTFPVTILMLLEGTVSDSYIYNELVEIMSTWCIMLRDLKVLAETIV